MTLRFLTRNFIVCAAFVIKQATIGFKRRVLRNPEALRITVRIMRVASTNPNYPELACYERFYPLDFFQFIVGRHSG